MFVQFIVFLFALIAATSKSLSFEMNNLTEFELKRRVDAGDDAAQLELRLRTNRQLLFVLQRVIEVLCVFMIAVLLVGSLQFARAAFFILIWLLLIEYVASRRWFHKFISHYLYDQLSTIIKVVESLPFLHFFVGFTPITRSQLFFSKEELLDFIKTNKDVLNEQESGLIKHVLTYEQSLVKNHMTKRSKVITIDKREIVGPLLLDRIHKSGQPHLLVVDKDIDNPVGVMTVANFTVINPDIKKVNDAQLGVLYYINQDLPISHAWQAILRTGSSMFIVVNISEEITGVINVRDVMQAILGQHNFGQFSQYEDRRAVAKLADTTPSHDPKIASPKN